MPTIYQLPMQVPGMVGVFPNQKFAVFGDNLATVTTAGYLNQVNLESNPVAPTDIIQALYSFNNVTQSGTYATFTVTISSSGVITLHEWSTPGAIVLPTIANHIATFTNTTGTISEDPATAISGGNIQAGLSGTAGFLASFPSAATSGSLRLTAVANSGDTVTTISNVAMGQASVVSIPDPANAIGRFVIGATATPFVSGNFPQNSGTGGLMIDSGLAVSAIATTSTAVLLTPAADQSITVHNLSVAQGNLTAGSSGHAGTVTSFPGTASKGSLILAAVNNTGNTNTTISNAAMGQASVISIPDPGGATADFVIAPSALVSGNFVKASGTVGLVVDGGAAIHAGTTGTYAGGGTSNAFTVTGMASTWIATAVILTSTNSVSITKAVPGTNILTVTFSADPGANTTVSWIATTAAI